MQHLIGRQARRSENYIERTKMFPYLWIREVGILKAVKNNDLKWEKVDEEEDSKNN